MTCKIIKGDGFTAFQCNPDPLGGQNWDSLIEQQRQEDLVPYKEGECPHQKQFELKGFLRCQDCGAKYNERTLEWNACNDE